MRLSTEGRLRLAVKLAFLAGVSTAAPSALAQEATPTPSAAVATEGVQLDALQVTGSRIKRADLASASPVTVITREEIEATGITDVGDLIQRLPSMSGSPIGTTTNNGGDGSVQVDLRGMGVARTLTLINGKRAVDGGDYQTIPAAMVERIEILKDGGSSIYGADAVAGVVNIITRQDYEGVSFDVQHNGWDKTHGGEQTTYSVIAGKNFTGGNFVFGAEFVDQKEAYQKDAPWDFFQNSYYIYPEGCEHQVAAPYDGTPQGGCYPLGSGTILEGRVRTRQGQFMNEGAGLVPYDGRTYNYAPVNYIQTPYQRTNLFAEGSFDVTDSIRFNSSIRGNFRQSAQELAATPYVSLTDPAYDGIYDFGDGEGPVSYHGISDQNYYLMQALSAYNTAHAEDEDFVALSGPATEFRRRMAEAPRRFTQDITQYQASFGFEGKFLDEYSWEVYYNGGRRSQVSRDFGQYSGARLANALGPSADLNGDGTPECYTDVSNPASLISGCVPLNLVSGQGTVTQEMLDYIGADLVDSIEQTQDEVSSSISGIIPGFALPAGPVGWAAGYQYRGETLDFTPDSGKQTSSVTGNKSTATRGSLYLNAIFGELYAPIYDNGEQALNLKGSARYDKYNSFDSETTWGAGIEANVIKSLKLRATAGTVFRAPSIGNLYGGESDDFPTYSDPCAPAAGEALPAACAQTATQEGQVLARVGGNPFLQPETGDTLTAGLVFTPKIPVGTVSLTVDYWKIKIDDGISSLGVQYVLDDCYLNGNASSCDLITRRADYSIAQVRDTSINVAKQSAEGVDTEVRFAVSPGLGRIETAFLWTHLLKRTKTPFPGADEIDLSGRYTDPTAEDGGAYAEDKINYSVTWKVGGASVGYLGEFISALDADTFCNCGESGEPYIQKIDSVLYHDLIAGYDFPWGTKIKAGITNLTNEAPPFIEVGFNATTDPSTYRMFGRGYFVRLSQEF